MKVENTNQMFMFKRAIIQTGYNKIENCLFYGFFRHVTLGDDNIPILSGTKALVKIDGSGGFSWEYPSDVHFFDFSFLKIVEES